MLPVVPWLLVIYPICMFLACLKDDSETSALSFLNGLALNVIIGILFAIATGWAAPYVFGYMVGTWVVGLLGIVIRRAL